MREASPVLSERSTVVFGPFRLDGSRQLLWRAGEPVAIGNRALRILCALLETPGELISKPELFRRVWPDLSVDEANLRVQIGVLRKALGALGGNIKSEAGLGYRYTGEVARAPGEIVRRRRRSRAPMGIDQLLGRERPLASVAEQIREHRLVTVVGPGGIGKTTLALAAAARLDDAYADGVCFVDFGLLTDPALVPTALAAALQQPVSTDDPLGAILLHLRDRDLLIVLDCCEHVIDIATEVAERVLSAAAGVHILATSREALRARGERVVELDALETPSATSPLTAVEAMNFSAVRLLARAAASSMRDFEVTDENADLVADICRRLDGIPLAIELAAALTGVLGLNAVRDGLDQRFALLTLGRRTSLPRHRTLAATLDWSYDLLSETSRAVLRRLATFAGAFPLNAAIEVASGDGIDEASATAAIVDLASKSLLTVDYSRETTLYRLLESTRVYARGRDAHREEPEQAARRHALYCLGALGAVDWERYDPIDDRQAVAPYVEEIRVALDWAFETDPDLAVRCSIAAERLWLELALNVECIQRMRESLAQLALRPESDPVLKMQVVVALSTAQIICYSPGLDRTLLDEALALAEQRGDRPYQLRGLWAIFHSLLVERQPIQAMAYARRFQRVVLEDPGPGEALLADHFLGWAHLAAGEPGPARPHFEAFLKHYVSPPRAHGVLFGFGKRVTAGVGLAEVLWFEGYPEQALAQAKAGLEEPEALQHPATSFYGLGYGACMLALFSGDLAASRIYLQAFDEAVFHFSRWGALAEAYRGLLARLEGDTATALRRLEGSLGDPSAAFPGMILPLLLIELSDVRRLCGDLAGAIDAADRALACQAGPEDAVTVCGALRAKAEAVIATGTPAAGAEAESLLLESLRIARKRGVLTPILTTGTALARLWTATGRTSEAKALLAPALAQMSEGHQLPPYRAAQDLLKRLDRDAAERGSAIG